MSDFSPLDKVDARLANAHSLMQIVYFFYENAEGADWVNMKDGLGALLNALSAELSAAERIIEGLVSASRTDAMQGREN